MNGACDEFLAAARRSIDEDGCREGRNAGDQMQHLAHGSAGQIQITQNIVFGHDGEYTQKLLSVF
jgi:hypothetical protein